MGGEKGLGGKVGQAVSLVAGDVKSVLIPDCGHFLPEQAPDAVVDQLHRLLKSPKEQ